MGRGRWHPAGDVLLLLLPLDSCPEVLCPNRVLPIALEQPLVATDLRSPGWEAFQPQQAAERWTKQTWHSSKQKKVEADKIGLKPKWKQELLLVRLLSFRLQLIVLEPRLELICH